MAKTREYAFVYLFGGIMYGLMEVIWRGHTHWTMTLTGGTALLILYIINIKMSNCNIFLKCLTGASAITLLEFTVGVIINIILKWNVCNGVQREHNKKLNNGLPILHKVPPKRDYGRYFCIMAEKGGTSHGGLTEKLSLFFHAKKQEVNAYGR